MSMLTQYESVFGALFYGWIYCIELFSAFLLLRAWEQRHPVLSQIPCLIALIYALFLLHALNKQATILDIWLYEMPLYFWFLNLAILSLSLAVVYVRDSVWKKTHVSDISVKESLDTLPTGVCYYEENGYVGLANDRMRTLCQMMTGLSLENGAQFRDAVYACAVRPECTVLRTAENPGDNPVFRVPDGRICSFRCYTIHVSSHVFYELIAADVTEEYEATGSLREKTEELKNINERLRQYGETVSVVTREREILAANVSIHDKMNHILLATRHCIEDGCSKEERAAMFDMWRGNVLLLCRESGEPRQENPISDLEEAASSIGIRLDIHGTMPRRREFLSLIMTTAAECISNTAKHTDCSVLHIGFEADRVWFSNDAPLAQKPLREGGGITAIRRAADEAGCTVQIDTDTCFRITLIFPR